MKDIIIVTFIDFWRGGAGHIARLKSLVDFLKDKSNLTVVYTGTYLEGDNELISKTYPDISLHFLERKKQLDISGYMDKFADFIEGKFFDVAFLEYVEMYFILDFFPEETIKILDTHDLVDDKINSFKKYNLDYHGMQIDFKQELSIFSEFDYVMLINEKDYLKVSKHMDNEKLLLVKHPVNFSKKTPRKTVTNITFVASQYAPNVDAIQWFIEEVWPFVNKQDVYLNIIGPVVKKLNITQPDSQIKLQGYVDDLDRIYEEADIIINPVRAGAGLKIKNVEALGNGIPLVTTTHGVSGLEDAASHSLLVANSSAEFINTINSLITNYLQRKNIADNAYEYAKQKFSIEQCYKQLTQFIN